MKMITFSIAILIYMLSSSAFADTTSEAFCKSKLKDSTFYNSIRTSPLGYYYNFNDVENNRFAMINEELRQNMDMLCASKASFTKLLNSTERECEKLCNKQVDSFKETIFLDKTKGKKDFFDDCHNTCFIMKENFKTYNLAISDNKSSNNECESQNDSISNLGRKIKDIESNIKPAPANTSTQGASK